MRYEAFQVIAISFVFQLLMVGSFSASTVFFVAYLDEFGWSHTLASSAFAIGSLVSVVGQPLMGWIIDQYGTRRVMIAGAALAGVGYLLNAVIVNVWQFWITNGFIVTLGFLCGTGIPNTVLLSQWFRRHRGTALGIAAAGGGIGMLIFPPLSGLLIERFDWRWAYVFVAMPMLIIALPLAVFALRDKSFVSSDGLGDRSTGHSATAGTRIATRFNMARTETGTTIQSALRQPFFWFLALAFFFDGISRQILLLFQTAAMVHAGYQLLFVTSIVGLLGGITAGSQVIGGWFSDRIGIKRTYALGSAALILGVSVLLVALSRNVLGLLIGFALLVGIGVGSHISANSMAITSAFHGSRLGLMMGFVFSSHSLGSSLGSLLGGWLFDHTASYQPAFLASLVLVPPATYCIWKLRPQRTQQGVPLT